MNGLHDVELAFALAPAILMAGAALWAWGGRSPVRRLWRQQGGAEA